MTSSGVDMQWVDDGVRVQDDLFRHDNGKWLDTAEIPPDRPMAGAFVTLRDEAEIAVRAIVEETVDTTDAGSETAKIGDLYASFMDTARREELGCAPIRPALDEVSNVADIPGLMTLLGQYDRVGVSGVFGFYVHNDAGNPDRYVIYLMQGGLGLPDESYYREERFADIVTAYEKHIRRMFEIVGVDDAERRAAAVLQLERDLAAHHWDVVTCRDPQKTYNLMSREQMDALQPYWAQWIGGLGASAGTFDEAVISQPPFFEALSELLVEDRLGDWKDWLTWQVINSASSFLTAEVRAERFDFYGRILSGTPEDRELWKRGVGFVEGVMGEAVGKIYVERHFPPVAKQRMDQLVANLIEAYRVDIAALPWMSEETKQKALIKLEQFTPKIGFPDKWRDYSALHTDRTDLVSNAAAAAAFELEYPLGKLGGPIDRTEWHMTPQTVNAYYMPTAHEILFPAAILQPPFFDAAADDAANYGGIGAVIGHEIGHGFDDKGSQFDGTGALRNWWTEADRSAFDELTQRLISQYDALEPQALPGHHVNGALTVGENIGDLGGLTIALAAYRIAVGDAGDTEIDGFTGIQRLFLAWGTIWQGKTRNEEAINRLATDPHAPVELRCNQIVRNMADFYAAFAITEQDRMWLAEADRVRIW